MKSPIVEKYEPEERKSGYTDLKVCSSAAGYYVGTMYQNVDTAGNTWEEPGSRDSDYFRTRELAERFLKTVTECHLEGALRQEP